MIITKHRPWIECFVHDQPAWCIAWYDYDQYSTTEWKCVIKSTGILVSVYEEEIRLDNNWTMHIGDKGPPGFAPRRTDGK